MGFGKVHAEGTVVNSTRQVYQAATVGDNNGDSIVLMVEGARLRSLV